MIGAVVPDRRRWSPRDPLIVSPTAAFGGSDGMATLFGEDCKTTLSPALRNHLRVTWMFAASAPLLIWSLQRMKERAGAFRIILGFAFAAGFASLTGRFADGEPGVIATALTAVELGLMPVLIWWHAQLIHSG
jgi:hypothetical protein